MGSMTTKSHIGLATAGTSDAGRKLSFLSDVLRRIGLRQRRFKLIWALVIAAGIFLLSSWGSAHTVSSARCGFGLL